MTIEQAGSTLVELEGARYVTSTELDLAVAVARATQRPLLLFGEPGSGKSSLARYVAYSDSLRYYEHVITARTSAKDLLWSFDSVRRLSDAQAQRDLGEDADYVVPGALWWAFDREGAGEFPRAHEPYARWNSRHSAKGAVVLIDEIDKADPDLPNSLLVPLAGRYFTVTDLEDGRQVADTGNPPSLVVITSNQERELPPAFERRCVVHRLQQHDDADLRAIADRHVGTTQEYPLGYLVAELLKARTKAEAFHQRSPSTAEFLDAVNACLGHEVHDDRHGDLPGIIKLIFDKNSRNDALEGM